MTPTDRLAILTAALRQAVDRLRHRSDADSHAVCRAWDAVAPLLAEPAPEPAPAPPPQEPAAPERGRCGDCRHFDRCKWLVQAQANHEHCDWTPSRWTPKQPAPDGAPPQGVEG